MRQRRQAATALAAPALATLLLPALALAAPPARAGELDLAVDLRAVASDATPSRLGGGLGALRYDHDHQGLRAGYLMLGYRADPLDTLHVSVDAFAWGDHDVNALDLTEAWAEWRPLPRGAWRSRVKLGAFYPEISLEDRMSGWRSPYTLSNSAINTWVGEELRTIGAQYTLDWLGYAQGHEWEASASLAAFGWNDTAGTVLAQRGWGLTDRQGTLFGRFANPARPQPALTSFYDDLDHRAGYHAGAVLRWRGLVELRALHYDNRASLAAAAPRIGDAAWPTRFESVGLRLTPLEPLTLAGQWLHGRTEVGTGLPTNAWSYGSEFVLASWEQGPWRWSARWDRFTLRQTATNFGFLGSDDGHAFTLAAGRGFGEHWSATLEWLAATSSNPARAFLGLAAEQRERQWQVAIRWEK